MENIQKQLQVTPISSLVEYAKGDVVQLPPFAYGKPFVARLKRPSMMVLMKSGKIPNSLLGAANSLFGGTSSDKVEQDEDFYKDVLGVIECLAEASFVEPTWNDIKEAGIELTDEQLMFLFNYTQKGVRSLESFRTIEENSGDTEDVKNVSVPSK